ncbi:MULTISPECIES: bifunctional diguanylate cyclase/phosphodiesterase [Shewanella]|nr:MULTISPECIES: bifunctional diguanylate cyclase/phosphodiesterase [Shewanella]NCQ44295.1 bifunctional diguanylate cyclase/phosphodiesterase [Shewanella frigidimarina]NCO72646.1 bifunctional diguanylate cyclase/phosphodiesterase [Shewanella vesiculosa]NCP35256.1 bifunctional diguanylate cyclase/phosphodiesterase [Shewanella vesiculosa]NCP69931.1 bifunctional diguanylate cyclase/phosphodiesterase [Shewanella vesiculosa]NCP73301.1 bifunctional diguanylate cyclase/phosphodiesterase [Shewanella v
MGDLLLQQVASRIKACVRESDTVSRLGGDEFVVMLKGLSEQAIVAVSEAEVVGKKILHSLSETYQLASHQYLITPSIGVTLLSADHQNADEVFKQADIAMYQSKKSGGCALFFYDPDMQAHLISRIRIETELREAISKGKQFELYYQPQINSLGIVTGAEALIRWNTADRGIVSPLEFIAIAEESGLILPLGDWVLETACQQLATWALEPKSAHLTLAVNISARQMGIPAFVENVLTIVSQANINPEKLKLELTESILLENMEDTITKMTALKARGIKFSIDDFGTGYSSLQYLKRLPLDQLKIDQSFIQDIENDPNDRAIVRTIIAMANSLNLEVIAEGVETEKQKELLTNKGCLNYQGYLFSKPLPLKMFNQYLTKH